MRAMAVELSDDPTVFLARDWTDLVLSDPCGSFFHTPSYLKLWWEEFGTGALLLAFVREEDRTIAVCCFELVGDALRFLGGFDVTDYMGPVGSPGVVERAANDLVAALASEVPWDRADFRGLPLDSPWHGALWSAAGRERMHVEVGEDGAAPLIALPESHDAYLAGLSSKLRHEMSRKERRLVQEAGPYRIHMSTPESFPADMTTFIELHRSSPGPKGRFMHAGMEIFFRRLGEAFLPQHVFHLAFIEVGGEKAAGAIGFAFRNTFSLYNSAFDRAFAHLSPGMVLVGELIRRAIEQRWDRFDLLKGDFEYKYRFGAVPRPVGRLVLRR